MWTHQSNQSFAAPQPQVNPQSLAYVIHVITYLAAHQTGTFNCVFYELHTSEPNNNFLIQLLQSPKLDSIAKIVLNGSFKTSYDIYPNKPSLMVIHVGNRDVSETFDADLWKSLIVWDPSCRVLVLADVSRLNTVRGINWMLKISKFHKVATIGTNRLRIVNFGCKFDDSRTWKVYIHPSELFHDWLRDMKGFNLAYSTRIKSHITLITMRGPVGPDVKWIEETARYLNTTALYVPDPCSKMVTARTDDCYHVFTLKNNIVITLDRKWYVGLSPKMYRTLFCVAPSFDAIVVPTGRQLNVVEVFLKPFAWAAWTWLIAVLVIMEAIRFKIPDVFRNNPILLAICGIERYDLHRAGGCEKISFISLIIAFFVMTSAYEAKIIALMTDPPTTGFIQSLDELSQSGLKVKVDLSRRPIVINDSIIGPLVVNSSFDMDGINAYYTNQVTAKVFLTMPINFDFKISRYRYVLLPEVLKMVVNHFSLQRRSQFLDVLHCTQRVFFESGLTDHWQREILMTHLNPKKYWRLAERDDPSGDGMLSIGDLAPAWISLGVGLSICICVFVSEVSGIL